MSWVEWLKGLAERHTEAENPADTGRQVRVRSPRKGGESYAKEWVRVLEDTSPGRDPTNTYTWELNAEAEAAKTRRASRAKQAASPPDKADPFDTYSWELQEGDSPDDPWGLNKDAPPQTVSKKDGINPYDTGVFDATWTGRFDQR